MTNSDGHPESRLGRVGMVVIMALGFTALAAGTGCDDYSDMILDSYEYQQSVYDNANDAWTEYIRM